MRQEQGRTCHPAHKAAFGPLPPHARHRARPWTRTSTPHGRRRPGRGGGGGGGGGGAAPRGQRGARPLRGDGPQAVGARALERRPGAAGHAGGGARARALRQSARQQRARLRAGLSGLAVGRVVIRGGGQLGVCRTAGRAAWRAPAEQREMHERDVQDLRSRDTGFIRPGCGAGGRGCRAQWVDEAGQTAAPSTHRVVEQKLHCVTCTAHTLYVELSHMHVGVYLHCAEAAGKLGTPTASRALALVWYASTVGTHTTGRIHHTHGRAPHSAMLHLPADRYPHPPRAPRGRTAAAAGAGQALRGHAHVRRRAHGMDEVAHGRRHARRAGRQRGRAPRAARRQLRGQALCGQLRLAHQLGHHLRRAARARSGPRALRRAEASGYCASAAPAASLPCRGGVSALPRSSRRGQGRRRRRGRQHQQAATHSSAWGAGTAVAAEQNAHGIPANTRSCSLSARSALASGQSRPPQAGAGPAEASTSTEQNGCESKSSSCGARTGSPVRLRCFFRILTRPV
jgi:hypothetical protein